MNMYCFKNALKPFKSRYFWVSFAIGINDFSFQRHQVEICFKKKLPRWLFIIVYINITKHYFNDVDLMGEDGITGIYIGIPHHSYII
jgi:hypothetical protein